MCGLTHMRLFRKSLLLALAILIIAICSVSDNSYALSFDMINPTGSSEGFTIINDESEDIDLYRFKISDGEGTVTFNKNYILEPQDTLTILSNTAEKWLFIEDYITFDSELIKVEGFSLNDDGDDIYIMDHRNEIIDAFAYGDSEPLIELETFQKIPKKHIAQRNHAFGIDGDVRNWTIHVPGRTMYHFEREFDAHVSPFSFPESEGIPILDQLQDAEKSIIISMYTFDNNHVASILKEKLANGCKITLLLEGQPAGSIDDNEVGILTSLWMSGADIRFIKSTDGYKRFDYLHTKYCVIDEHTTIITSENWTDYAFSNNRGWGAVIQSKEFSQYISDIFESDIEGLDIHEFREIYPTSLPKIIREYTPTEYKSEFYECKVIPVISPDYSFKSINRFIEETKYRLFAQQLNVDYDWLNENENVLQSVINLGRDEIDTRLFLDVTYADPNDSDQKDGYGIFTALMDSEYIDVRYNDNGILYHNKGIISDDRTWIGSMNWTDTSIYENRELSVIIDSTQVTDFFAELFRQDWGNDFNGNIELIIEYDEAEYGEYITFDASDSSVPFGSSFFWDFDSNGEFDKEGKTVNYRLFGETEITLTVIDVKSNTYTETITISLSTEDSEFSLPGGPIKYVPLILLCTLIILVRRYRSK